MNSDFLHSSHHRFLSRHVATLTATICTLSATLSYGQTLVAPNYQTPSPPVAAESAPLRHFADLLHELDHRRRLQFLFPNPQSKFDGISIGYVQTSSGNLTFKRRDLVVLGKATIVSSRIYDSRSESNYGFGPGWLLNLSERLEFEGGVAYHHDENGARHRFHKRADGRYYHTLAHGNQFTSSILSLQGSVGRLAKSDGSVLEFSRVGDLADLALVKRTQSGGAVIELTYEGALLKTITVNGSLALSIDWLGDRIANIGDRHGRQARYEYDDLNRLVAASDIAGQVWTYEYDRSNRLTTAAYPDRQAYLSVEYGVDGKVSKVSSTRDFAYHYYRGATTVLESSGEQHAFKFNDQGITIGYRNNSGIDWELGLDGSNRVASLSRNGDSYRFRYSDKRLTRMEHPEGLQSFHYDHEGRYTHSSGTAMRGYLPKQATYGANGEIAVHDDDSILRFKHTEPGPSTSMQKDDIVYEVTYNADGLPTSLRRNDTKLQFSRDDIGRINGVSYPDRTASIYRYDALGNRDYAEFSNGTKLSLQHDGRGNIVRVTDTNPEGIDLTQSYAIDRLNRVTGLEFDGSKQLEIQYDDYGRPNRFSTDGNEVNVEYIAGGEPVRLRSDRAVLVLEGKKSQSFFTSGHVSLRSFLHNDERTRAQPDYGLIEIDQQSLDIRLRPVEMASVPGYAAALNRLSVADSWLDPDNRGKIEKPSNPIFQPPEYESTNCCTSCLWHVSCGDICINLFIGIGEESCMCFSPKFFSPGGGGGGGGGSSCFPDHSPSKKTARALLVKTLEDTKKTPYSPYEQVYLINCPHTNKIGSETRGPSYNQCPPTIQWNPGRSVYLGHSHPKYVYPRDRNKALYCGNEYLVHLRTRQDISDKNEPNEMCSKSDIRTGNKVPLLLRYPSGRIVNCGKKR